MSEGQTSSKKSFSLKNKDDIKTQYKRRYKEMDSVIYVCRRHLRYNKNYLCQKMITPVRVSWVIDWATEWMTKYVIDKQVHRGTPIL